MRISQSAVSVVLANVPPAASAVPSGTYDVCSPSSRSTASTVAKWRGSRRIARTAPCPAENAASVTCATRAEAPVAADTSRVTPATSESNAAGSANARS